MGRAWDRGDGSSAGYPLLALLDWGAEPPADFADAARVAAVRGGARGGPAAAPAAETEAELREEADRVAEWLDAREPGVLACWDWLTNPANAARGAAWREQGGDIDGLLRTDVGCLWRLWLVHCPARGSSIVADRDAFEPKQRGLSGELWAQYGPYPDDGPRDEWMHHARGARAARGRARVTA